MNKPPCLLVHRTGSMPEKPVFSLLLCDQLDAVGRMTTFAEIVRPFQCLQRLHKPIALPEGNRPMPHLSHRLKNSRHTRNAMLSMLAIASATLLGGCSVWPKASAAEESAPVVVPAEPAQAVAPTPCVDCPNSDNPSATAIPQGAAAPQPLQAKPEVTSTAMAEPVKAEASPPVKVEPAVLAAPPKPAATPQTKTASDLAHGFYINVGLFAVPTNGSNAHQKLESAG